MHEEVHKRKKGHKGVAIMIRIGLSDIQKNKHIQQYLLDHTEINKVYVFNWPDFALKVTADIPVVYTEYKEIIMYRTFYTLLESIDKNSLIVINECMRTKKRNDLTYNCAHKYLNQTPHHIVFNYFPIIDDKEDFMILVDFDQPDFYALQKFDRAILHRLDIKMRARKIKIEELIMTPTEKQRAGYEKKKEALFDNLGKKDPVTIPRDLQIYVGNMKKSMIDPALRYIARNKRFKQENVYSYNDNDLKSGNYIVLDTHYRRLDFNDFLQKTMATKIKYVTTTLPVDNYISTELTKWKARCEALYAQANLFK